MTDLETAPLRWGDVIAGAGVQPVFQPILDLDSRTVVAYEALARWPGQADMTPNRVFAAARREGTLTRLDRACRAAAVHHALLAGLPSGTPLFVNAEPAALAAPGDVAGVDELVELAGAGYPLVVELTERDLLRSPAGLLGAVHAAREVGCRIALDDVGAHPDSLALLDLVRPDVVKLDLSLVQQSPSKDQARTLAAVMAYSEWTGAPLLAEGIETMAHLERALACGAVLGQGWMFGRPEPFPVGQHLTRHPARGLKPTAAPVPTPHSPADLIGTDAPARVATKRWLIALSRHIETQALNIADPPVVFAALQTVDHFTAFTRDRYQNLAKCSPLVAVFGQDLPSSLGGNVRGVPLAADDPLVGEWTVVVLGAQTAAALIATDLGDTGADSSRRFAFAVTHDRDKVTRAARSLASRLTGDATAQPDASA